MGTTKTLHSQDAIEKMQDLGEDAKICMMLTNLGTPPFHTRPMATQKIDDDGTCWFFSPAGSTKNADIMSDDRAQVIYANRSSSEYMMLYGTVEIIKDKQKAEELWNVFLTTWFPDGVDDPELTLLKFTPTEGHYWDTKNNKMVQSVKIAIGAIRGKMTDDGVEGELVL